MTPPAAASRRLAPRTAIANHRQSSATRDERIRMHVDGVLFHLIARAARDGKESDGQARIDQRRQRALRDAAVDAIRAAGKGASLFLLLFSYRQMPLALSSRPRGGGLEIWISPAPRGLSAGCMSEADAARSRPEPSGWSRERQPRLPRGTRW